MNVCVLIRTHTHTFSFIHKHVLRSPFRIHMSIHMHNCRHLHVHVLLRKVSCLIVYISAQVNGYSPPDIPIHPTTLCRREVLVAIPEGHSFDPVS